MARRDSNALRLPLELLRGGDSESSGGLSLSPRSRIGSRSPSPTPRSSEAQKEGKKKKEKRSLFRRSTRGERKASFVFSEEGFDKSYALDVELGKGARGVVWKGRHIESGCKVAIKKIESLVELFVREHGPLQQRIRHPNVVHYYGSVLCALHDRSFVWQVMEYCEYGSVGELMLKRIGYQCSEAEVAAIMTPVLRGLGYLHEQGVAHGNLSLRRIFISEGYQVKLGGVGSPVLPDSARLWPPERTSDQMLEPTPKWDMWDFGRCLLALTLSPTSSATSPSLRSMLSSSSSYPSSSFSSSPPSPSPVFSASSPGVVAPTPSSSSTSLSPPPTTTSSSPSPTSPRPSPRPLSSFSHLSPSPSSSPPSSFLPPSSPPSRARSASLTSSLETITPEPIENRGFSPEFQGFVECCLQKNPRKRPKGQELLQHPFCTYNANLYEFADIIKRLCEGGAGDEYVPPTPSERVHPPPPSDPAWVRELVEENARLREEVRSLLILRQESTHLVRHLLTEVTDLRQQASYLEQRLYALLPTPPHHR